MKMFVAGEWTEGSKQEEVRNPFSGEVVDTVPVAVVADAQRALDAAVTGSQIQREMTAHERQAILLKAATLADERVEQLARTISAESGKTLTEATGEASRAGEILRLSAFEGSQLYGESLPLDAHKGAGRSKLGFTLRQPCGVVVAITPFNFPSLLVLHKIGPALATGNAVVLKPARTTPLTALLLAEILLDAGLPPQALSVLPGPGGDLGDVLCSDPRVRKISFTGSTSVGEHITRVAGVKKLSLELGASCPVVVLPDADLELAATSVATGGYGNAGQVCISVQRVIADGSIAGDFLDALNDKVAQIRTGDPLDPATTMGSLITQQEAERVHAAIQQAAGEGAKILRGGDRDGAVVEPTIVTDVNPDSAFSQEELFGPAVAVTRATTVDEAVALANNTRYGLGAGIFTRDVSNAVRFARDAEAGNVHVNWSPLWRADLMPYGGFKGSGIGKEGCRAAVHEMTEQKTVILHG
jgi:acyl-CoA reductase-like NAD-dependent aldehyde dehydrogenase